MARQTPEQLTAAEWKVMKIIWEKKSCAARDVTQTAQKEHDWAASTVKTLLRRLVDKGFLKTTQVGNSFLYRPAQGAMKPLYGAADTLLGNALEGTVAPLLAYMAKKSSLSSAELAELRELFARLSPTEEDDT